MREYGSKGKRPWGQCVDGRAGWLCGGEVVGNLLSRDLDSLQLGFEETLEVVDP